MNCIFVNFSDVACPKEATNSRLLAISTLGTVFQPLGTTLTGSAVSSMLASPIFAVFRLVARQHHNRVLLLLTVLHKVLQHSGHRNHCCCAMLQDGTCELCCTELGQKRMLGPRQHSC